MGRILKHVLTVWNDMAYKTIIKENGDRVRFSKAKVELSLRRSGASPRVAKSIANKVANEITKKSTTSDVYRHAYDLLKKEGEHPTAARYNLKKAIQALGPTGFPFEQFIARLLEYRGLKTEVGVVVQGRCVTHEIDVLATDENKERYVECKFHRRGGYATDVKVPLYIRSRFQDIEDYFEDMGDTSKYRQPWIVTNTRFSDDAIQYAECSGIKLIGWRYPHGNGLEHLVEEIGLYPVTVLSFLNDTEKAKLLKKDIVLCVDIVKDPQCLVDVGVPKSRLDKALKEAQELCHHPTV